MSTQKSIIDTLVSAVSNISGINKVTKDLQAWNQADPNSLSIVYVSMKKGEGEQVFFRHATSPDMYAELEITIQGEIYELYDTNVETNIDTLMVNVENVINSDSPLDALLIDIYLESDEYVKVDNHGLFTAVYIADFYYNHLSP